MSYFKSTLIRFILHSMLLYAPYYFYCLQGHVFYIDLLISTQEDRWETIGLSITAQLTSVVHRFLITEVNSTYITFIFLQRLEANLLSMEGYTQVHWPNGGISIRFDSSSKHAIFYGRWPEVSRSAPTYYTTIS